MDHQVSIEISFNQLKDKKAFLPLFNDKITVLILRCNNLDINFAKEAVEPLKKLSKMEYINF